MSLGGAPLGFGVAAGLADPSTVVVVELASFATTSVDAPSTVVVAAAVVETVFVS